MITEYHTVQKFVKRLLTEFADFATEETRKTLLLHKCVIYNAPRLVLSSRGREGATEYYGFVIAVVQSFLFLTVIYVILKLFLNKHTVTGIVLKSTFGGYFACPCQLPTYSLQRGVNATFVS